MKIDIADIDLADKLLTERSNSSRGVVKYAIMLASASIQEDDKELLADIIPDLEFFVGLFDKFWGAQLSDACIISDYVLAMKNLAAVDDLRAMLGKHGVIPSLIMVFEHASATALDKEFAASSLWNLSYDNNNRGILKAIPNALQIFRSILEDDHTEATFLLRKNLSGVMQLMGEPTTHLPMTLRQEIGLPSRLTGIDHVRGHIMLSYNWGSQPLVLWIRHQLQRAGYRVWVDVEEMKGSTLEAMAQAAEDASAFVMVMTDAYKNSPNCRAEAEYAWTISKRNKGSPPIIPIMAQVRKRV
jgi:male-specific lethal 1